MSFAYVCERELEKGEGEQAKIVFTINGKSKLKRNFWTKLVLF